MPGVPSWRRFFLLLPFLVLLVLAVVTANDAQRYEKIDLATADIYIQKHIEEKNARLGITPTVQTTPYPDLYTELLDETSLTGEKRNALLHLRDREYHGNKGGSFFRAAYQLAGKLPADQPRLTLTTAKAILTDPPTGRQLVESFNAVAGAPDYMVTTMLTPYWIFFLDENGDEVIQTDAVRVTYIRYDAHGNEQTRTELLAPQSPATSAPATAP